MKGVIWTRLIRLESGIEKESEKRIKTLLCCLFLLSVLCPLPHSAHLSATISGYTLKNILKILSFSLSVCLSERHKTIFVFFLFFICTDKCTKNMGKLFSYLLHERASKSNLNNITTIQFIMAPQDYICHLLMKVLLLLSFYK